MIGAVNSLSANAAPGDPGHHVGRSGRRIADAHDLAARRAQNGRAAPVSTMTAKSRGDNGDQEPGPWRVLDLTTPGPTAMMKAARILDHALRSPDGAGRRRRRVEERGQRQMRIM